MSQRSVTHATFTLERHYEVPPRRVFTAWADPAAKSRWFAGPEEFGGGSYESDFRVGGREFSRGGPQGGPIHTYSALYHDIVPNERIVYSYDMHMDETRISVSLATVEFRAERQGTTLVFTEHGAFLDGYDAPTERERGKLELLDALGVELRRISVDA